MIRLWIERLALLLVIGGALNWGLVGLVEIDLVAEVAGEAFGTTTTVSRIIYLAVGAAAIVFITARAADMHAPVVDMERIEDMDRIERPVTAA